MDLRILFLSLVCFSCSLSTNGRTLYIDFEIYKYDEEIKIHTYSHPRVKIDNSTILSDRLTYDKTADILTFTGDVVISQPKILLTADRATIDQNTAVNTLHRVTMVDKANNAFIEAEKIEQISEEEFIVHNGSLTRCSPDSKAWELRSRRIVYQTNDFAYSLNTTIHFYALPVFYSPFFSWPTKKERASGLLPPTVLIQDSSDQTKRYGARLRIPYFFALDREHDLTLTADLMEKRGSGIDADYQYAFRQGMAGQFRIWYLDEEVEDRDLDDPAENVGSMNRYTDAFDLGPTRYKYSLNHRQSIFFDGQLFFQQYQNSDNEINKEYFDSTVTLDTHFSRTLSLIFPWSNGSLSFNYDTTDNFTSTSIFDTANDADTHLNKHPSVLFSQRFTGIFDSFVSISLSGVATNFERTYGWKGVMKQGSIGLTAPFFLDFINVLPGWQRDFYDFSVRQEPQVDDEQPDSFGWNIDKKNLELNMEIFRIYYNEEHIGIKKLLFRPRLIYQEILDVDQAMAVDKGFISTVPSRRSLTYRWETLFLTKSPVTQKVRTVLQLYFTQIYDLDWKENNELLNHSLLPETEAGDTKLPLRLELIVSPTRVVSASLKYRYDHQESRVIETVIGLSAVSADGSSFSLSYTENTKHYHELDDTNRPAAQAYTISHLLKLGNRLDLSFTGNFDQSRNNLADKFSQNSSVNRLDRQLTSFVFALKYKHNCYNITATYAEEIDQQIIEGISTEFLDKKVSFTLMIPALPGAGAQAGQAADMSYQQNYLLD